MKVLDLFCGTKSIAKAFKEKGHEVYTVDWDEQFDPTLVADIGKLSAEDIINMCGGRPDVIWASPDCTTFSVAAIGRHRRKDENGILLPKTEYAKQCDDVDTHLIELLNELQPKYWFIENPRGGMRKATFTQNINDKRHTVTYCQYGDTKMKPTDIWTNHPNPKFKPPCKNGDPCHEPAPRGSSSGVQKLNGAKNRAVIPKELCEHIVDICEEE